MNKILLVFLLFAFMGCDDDDRPCGCENEMSAARAKHGEPDEIRTWDGSGWDEGYHWVEYVWAVTDSTTRMTEFYWGSGDGSDICCDVTHFMCADGVCDQVGRIHIEPSDSYLVR